MWEPQRTLLLSLQWLLSAEEVPVRGTELCAPAALWLGSLILRPPFSVGLLYSAGQAEGLNWPTVGFRENLAVARLREIFLKPLPRCNLVGARTTSSTCWITFL
jgi:hypothetical protein